jgi:carbonic anhydrase
MSNRWIYRGSFTYPNCVEGVYWNVARKVYPIKAADLLKFTNLLKAFSNGESPD